MKTSVLACFLLAGCDAPHAPDPANRASERETRSANEPEPSVPLVDEVESRVRQLPCVENLSRWDRDYRYDFRGQKIDTTRIMFVLTATDGKSRRHINRPHDTYHVPSGKYRLIAGVFNVVDKTLKVEKCGHLVGGTIS